MKINFLRLVFLVVATSMPFSAVADESSKDDPLAVSIAVPFSSNGERVLYYSHFSFPVLITNRSPKAQRVWKDWNSWGYYALFFEITDPDGKSLKLTKIMPHAWTMNGPDYWTIPPGESLVINVDLSDTETWEPLPKPKDFPATFKISALFEVGADAKSKKFSVWTGRIASKAETYTLYNPR
jgi:hypothetical protein